ncbi:hypothetical protein Rhopal_006848-T1 [Rhodotorula paludigena]|uniref:Programmed cell death protein 2 C-terminal domain-containing protein n=1 Tax=Rhodotorula paludigena TaxID=86838 RepID=A0AAV5GV41_9BASI|nr:hypothetical protein Rhopal_006848-T1 [Rhodotorula paludigena]
MASLTLDQQRTFDACIGLDLPADAAERAALRYNDNVEAAINWIFDGCPDNAVVPADLPPPLVAAADDESLPHPSMLGQNPPPYTPRTTTPVEQHGRAPLPAPFVPPKDDSKSQLIDLTDTDEGSIPAFAPPRISAPNPSPRLTPTKEDDELARAIKASQVDADDGDDELSKAISMSMATLGSTEEEAVGIVESIKPEDRIREPETPTVLRATSNLMSSLAAYFQCLYAIPTYRQAILSYRAPQGHPLHAEEFKDYWKGDAGLSVLGLPMGVGDDNREKREYRLIALQRLFAIMTDTHRAFVHVTEVVRAFGLRESDFSRPGAWSYAIKHVHETIVEDLRIAAGEEARHLLEQGVPADEVQKLERKAADRFTLNGRPVLVDEHIGAPLPPLANEDGNHTSIMSLNVNPVSDPPQNLFSLLDSQLVASEGDSRILHLLTRVPSTLAIHLYRQTTVTSLDTFGSAGGAAPSKRVFRPTKTGAEDVWLDRYWVKNRVGIVEARGEIARLEGELEEVKRRRREVGTTQEGKDARELVRGTVEYLKAASAPGNEEREERQKRLREQWEKVGDEMDSVLQAYDADASALDERIAAIFDTDAMHKVGPFRLVSILMHNGLNGRGTAWAVVRGDDDRWWKIVDLVKEEVTLEQALADPSGLMMDAGATFLFYQKMDEVEECEVPMSLKSAVLRDNHDFAASLPPSLASTVASWKLPSPSSLEPEAIQIPLTGLEDVANDDDTVREIALDSPPPVDIAIDDSAPPSEASTPVAADTPMSLDASEQESQEGAAMQLRGGATVEDAAEDESDEEGELAHEEDEDEYDDDEIDEDEVELGLLKPMPASRDDWDIDFAVGKVGGLPRWLDPRSPLAPEDVQCGTCGKTMSLLLQVNSPDDERPHAAARSLYVWACRVSGCLAKDPSQAVRVWRTQMESPNAFYPHTEETLKERKRLEDALDPTSALSSAPSTSSKPWPEFDVAAEPEPYEESYLPDPSAPAPENEEGTEDAAATDTKTGVDRAFLAFQERIEREPKQVMRFYRIPGVDDPQPLWASSKTITPEEIPTCELCRAERKVEFQVLSTLLPSLEDDSFDFDSLLVYTCSANCPIPPRDGGKTGWASEVAFKQDFAAEGVRFGVQR